MKLKFGTRKSLRATPTPLRTPNAARAPQDFAPRTTRVWSLLLPPSQIRR